MASTARARTAATRKVRSRPTCATPVADRTVPRAMLPCPNIIRNAFIRPRTHPGITRCPATQSSDPTSAQATPASVVDLHALRVAGVPQRTDERFRKVFAELGRLYLARLPL